MNLLEAIEKLCEVVRLQAEIIQKQAVVIEQSKIADEVADELRNMRETAKAKQSDIEKFYN